MIDSASIEIWHLLGNHHFADMPDGERGYLRDRLGVENGPRGFIDPGLEILFLLLDANSPALTVLAGGGLPMRRLVLLVMD